MAKLTQEQAEAKFSEIDENHQKELSASKRERNKGIFLAVLAAIGITGGIAYLN